MLPSGDVGLDVLPRSLDFAARRARLRREGKSRAATLGMTEKNSEGGETLRDAQGKKPALRGGRKRKKELGAGFGAGADAEVGADVGGAFAHDGQAPVGFAAGVEELGLDAGAVVADGDAELAGGVGDFGFDPGGLGMAKGVQQGFASN